MSCNILSRFPAALLFALIFLTFPFNSFAQSGAADGTSAADGSSVAQPVSTAKPTSTSAGSAMQPSTETPASTTAGTPRPVATSSSAGQPLSSSASSLSVSPKSQTSVANNPTNQLNPSNLTGTSAINTSNSDQPTSSATSTSKKDMAGIVVSVVLALIIVLPFGYYLAQKLKSKKKEKPEEEKHPGCFNIKQLLDNKLSELTDLKGQLQDKAVDKGREVIMNAVSGTKVGEVLALIAKAEEEYEKLKKMYEECTVEFAKRNFMTEPVQPSLDVWNSVKDKVTFLEQEAFGENAFPAQELAEDFSNKDNINILLKVKESGEIIGFACVEPIKEDGGAVDEKRDTANLSNIVIDKKYQGQRLVASLLNQVEDELKKQKYIYLQMNTAKANNFAANIAKTYKDRIVESKPHDSKWGQQVFFKIRL